MPLSVTVKTSRTSAARGALAAHREPHAAALGELHRVVDRDFPARRAAAADRRSPPPADRRQFRLGLRAPWPRRAPRAKRASASARRRGRNSSRRSTRPRRRRARHRRSARSSSGEMLGRALDRRRPAALALAELGGRQQLAQRQNAGQRRADLVGEVGERRLDRARPAPTRRGARALRPASPLARSCSLRASHPRRTCHGRTSAATASRPYAQLSPDHRGGCRRASRPAPAARAGAVARVDFDSLRPSASRIRRWWW